MLRALQQLKIWEFYTKISRRVHARVYIVLPLPFEAIILAVNRYNGYVVAIPGVVCLYACQVGAMAPRPHQTGL